MAKEDQEKELRADEEVRKNLPPGVKLVRTLRGHTNLIGRIAWSPDGRLLASPSADRTIRLWDAETGKCIRTLTGHREMVIVIAFSPTGQTLASGGGQEYGQEYGQDLDAAIRLWDINNDKPVQEFGDHLSAISGLAFDPSGTKLASGSYDATARLWDIASSTRIGMMGPAESNKRKANDAIFCLAFNPADEGIVIGSEANGLQVWEPISGVIKQSLPGHSWATNFAIDPQGQMLASGGDDRTIKIWDARTYRLLRTLEGHTDAVTCVGFHADGKLLATRGRSGDSTIRLWHTETGACVAKFSESTGQYWMPGLAFHPHRTLLAAVGSDPGTPQDKDRFETVNTKRDRVIHIYELDLALLFGQSAAPSITYTSAKVVLVGDSGVGKTGLGWRLAHDEFKEHASTHGQQFWLLSQLCQERRDGAQCEAVLWDLAGQDDYRLIHALFLDDADLALLLFDPTSNDDPLRGVEFWLKQLKVGKPSSAGTPTVLIAARSDRGTPRLTREELEAFCKQRGIAAYLATSAKDGEGISDLVERMQGLIPWNDKPATVTTETFKRIKDFVLGLKENSRRRKVILTPEDLSRRLEKTDRKWKFTDEEMLTAVGHLANHGYVTRLKTSRGEPRILLAPELLNNLAASFVLEARRNRKGLGSLEEEILLSGGYKFPELEKLAKAEKDILIDSAAVLFLEHNMCFRETDPLQGRAYYVFPELINLKRPVENDVRVVEDDVAYTVSGAVENVYASMVVLMGYTQTFTRTNQWRNHARYEVGNGQVCGFRLEEERAGELDFTLYFGADTDAPVQMLFQSLFENFLARRNLTVRRFEPVNCSKGHQLNRAVVREQISRGAEFAFCNRCGEEIRLPKADQPIQLTRRQAAEVEANRRAADQRSRFEQVLFRLKKYATEQKTAPPQCFISYAWGNPEHERWVEKSLATDLQKAGIPVVLDRWENARIGASVPRFVERVGSSDRVIVVGTKLYRRKYDNKEPMRGFVVAAEGDLIGKRMIGTEEGKESVLPLLLEGTEETAFPNLLHGRVYADFRPVEAYFDVVLGLLLSLYGIRPSEPVAAELQETLSGSKV
jgi:small GTP-binding protein